MTTENSALEELPNDNDLMLAAMGVPDDDEPDGTEEAATPPAAPPAVEGAPPVEPPADPDAFDLTALRKVAAERQAQREPPKVEPTAAPTPDLAQLADHMSGAAEMRAAIDAYATGDASGLAKLAGKDEATLYELQTKRAMGGDTAGLEQRLVAQQAEIEALKTRKPEGVLTVEAYKAIQQQATDKAEREEFVSAVSNPDDFPVLGRVAAAAALRYGDEAADLLREAGSTLSFASVSQVAEQLALKELGGLMAQQVDGRTGDGGNTEAGANSPNAGSTRTSGLDNNAAAEAASALPDFLDEAALIARATKAAEAD